jgi:hypothetical protein
MCSKMRVKEKYAALHLVQWNQCALSQVKLEEAEMKQNSTPTISSFLQVGKISMDILLF